MRLAKCVGVPRLASRCHARVGISYYCFDIIIGLGRSFSHSFGEWLATGSLPPDDPNPRPACTSHLQVVVRARGPVPPPTRAPPESVPVRKWRLAATPRKYAIENEVVLPNYYAATVVVSVNHDDEREHAADADADDAHAVDHVCSRLCLFARVCGCVCPLAAVGCLSTLLLRV